MESIHNFCFKQQYWYQLVWNTAQSSLHISYSSWINILEGLPTSLMLLPWIQRLAPCDSHFAEAAEILLSESLPSDLRTSGRQFSPAFLSHDNCGLIKRTLFPAKMYGFHHSLPCPFLWLLYHLGLKNLGWAGLPGTPKCLWQLWPGLSWQPQRQVTQFCCFFLLTGLSSFATGFPMGLENRLPCWFGGVQTLWTLFHLLQCSVSNNNYLLWKQDRINSPCDLLVLPWAPLN